MNSTKTYDAPWGKLLIIMTAIVTLILTAIPVIALLEGPEDNIFYILIMIILPLLILAGSMLFMIRGYVISDNTLFVRRLLWNTTIGLSNLKSVEVNPKAMSKSIRTFGNGGLFSFSGFFRNKQLGSYRAFATDLKRSVVLKFTDRTIVVTPEKPDEFSKDIKLLRSI